MAPNGTRWDAFADTVFRHYGEDQGLPVPPVTALAQDGAGFIWVGTQNGLARFDGYRFKRFVPQPGNPAALPGSFVTTLHTDASGRLWVGTTAGGLARVEGDRFAVYNPRQGGLHGVGVRAIADDGAGGVWVATEGGLDHVDAAGVLLPRPHGADAAGPAAMQTVLRARNGDLWLGTHAGLFRRTAAARHFVPVALEGLSTAPSVTALFEDATGRLWAGTARNGAWLIDAASGHARPLRAPAGGDDTLATLDVSSFVAATAQQIWIGTYGQGIVAVDTRTLATHHLRHDPVLGSSLMHDDVWALLRDRAGTLWVGDSYALEQLATGNDAILTLFGGQAHASRLSGADVSAVHAMADGRVWFGYRSGAVDIFDPVRGRVAHLAPDPAHPEHALPAGYVRTFAVAGSAVYIGTNRGLYRTDLAGRAVTRVAVAGREDAALVDALCVDAGVLWIGGHDKGVFTLALTPGAKPVVDHLDAPALTDSRVSDIVRGRGQDMWIATYNGLNRLDLATGKLEQARPDPARADGLTAGVVTALRMDRAGRLWVGMAGGGIAVLENAAGAPHFRRIGAADGLPNAVVDALLEDAAGRMWASTDNGLAVIDPATKAVRALHRAAGAVIRIYWAGSATATAQGELVFGGNGGITVVRSQRLAVWGYRPPIVVTDLRVGGHAATWNARAATVPSPIQVPAAADTLSVEFAALDYTAPERNRYAYRLDGFDHDWIPTDSARRLAVYANLPPGSYQLRLRGSNRDGVWSTRTLDLPIQVQAAWYQTLVFRLLAALAALIAIFALVHWRTAYLHRRRRALERQVQREKSAVRRLQQAERLQRALYAIAELTSSSIERAQMLQRLHEIVASLMYADNFYIVLYDNGRNSVRVIYFVDVKDPAVYDPEQEIPAAELAGSATLLLIQRATPLRGSSAQIRAAIGDLSGRGPEAEAWLGVPMIAAGEVCGALVVQSYDRSIQYTESDQELLAYVAGHILTALSRRQAKEALESEVTVRTRALAQANRDLSAQIREREAGERLQSVLFRIAELSSAGGSISEFLRAAHAEISTLLYARNFYVGLLVEDRQAMEYPYAVDERDTSAIFQRDRLRHGLTEYVLRRGEPLLAYPETIEALVQAGEVARIGTPSVCWLGVPLLLGGRIEGVLVVQSYTAGVVYSARDQDLLTFVALHLATALERRQGQESLKDAYRELQGRIDELRRTQSELIENEKMASLGRLVAGVAHEINTPLGIGVTAASHLVDLFAAIESELDGDLSPSRRIAFEDARRCVQLILSNLGKADHLVKSFKQVAVDQSSEEHRRILVKSYLEDVLASLAPRFKRTLHRVELDCPATLEIDTLPGALYQIVANMLINALVHAFDDASPGLLRIGARRLEHTFELCFADDGKGMREDVRLKVFEPFFTTRRGAGGTGLGLHLVYNLVTQLLHGSIDCRSAPGQGTVFTIRLPLAAPG